MDIDSDPDILERQMQEVLKSLGIDVHVVQFVLPTDGDLPPAQFTCDHHFHLGEEYLAGNLARLATRRFNQALAAYDGRSSYKNFEAAVKLALAEAHAAVDVKEWDKALDYVAQVLSILPDDDRALATKARIHVRRTEPVDAYLAAIAALKVNPKSFEAACYLGLMGFHIARAAGDVETMALSIKNLKLAQSLQPSSREMAALILQCEHDLCRLSTA
jgi:tetratricopeptide (TPR) repeat protein